MGHKEEEGGEDVSDILIPGDGEDDAVINRNNE